MKTYTDKIDEQTKREWDLSYNVSKEQALWGENPVPYISEAIVFLRNQKAIKVLDIPCGDGRNTIPITRAFSIVVAVDASINALLSAKKNFEINGIHNCILVENDIFKTNFLENQFDGIICWDVLGHLKNVSAAINELIRICEVGGYVIGSLFSDTDSVFKEGMCKIGENEFLYSGKFYYKSYNEYSVRSLLNSLGNVEIKDLKHIEWIDLPHVGFREYCHEHHSWVFILKKIK